MNYAEKSMLIILQKIIVSLTVAIIPTMIKAVFVNETVLEYALYTKKEKEQKRIYNDIVAVFFTFFNDNIISLFAIP